MTIFDQRGQTVTYQYNFGAVDDVAGLLGELRKLQGGLQQAVEAQAVTGEPAVEARYNLDKAVLEAEKPAPDKKKIGDYLTTARTAIEGVAAASGLVVAITKAAELVEKLFQ